MPTLNISCEDEDGLTTSLAKVLSDLRAMLQGQSDDIERQLEAWSARQECLLAEWLKSVTPKAYMRDLSQRNSEAAYSLVPHDSCTTGRTCSDSIDSNMLEQSERSSHIEQLRKIAVERSGWRGRTSLQNEKRTSEKAPRSYQDRPEPKYHFTKRSGSEHRSRFDPDRIVEQVFVDRECERAYAQMAQHDRRKASTDFLFKHCCPALRNLIKSRQFDLFCGVLIIGNAVLLGVEVDFLACGGSAPVLATFFQTVLNVWYFAELLLRYWAAPDRFCAPEEWRWNAVDVFTIIPSILDLTAETLSLTDATLMRVVRTLRMLRIVRLLRIAKHLAYVREFRKMAFCLLSSTQTLFWSTLLIFFIIYNFALWFTQSAASILNSNVEVDEQSLHDLGKYFGSLSLSIRTLFMSITGGLDWEISLHALRGADDITSSGLFCAYVGLACFGVLNIVTSVFVESAMQSTQYYKDLLVEEKALKAKAITDHLKHMFSELAGDRDGTISFGQMENILDGKNTHVLAYFEALGLEVDDARAFFRLLDIDGSGKIDIDEFCYGCMKLKGEARSIDLNCMIYEGRAMVRTWSEFMHFVEQEFRTLRADWHSIAYIMDTLLDPMSPAFPPEVLSSLRKSCNENEKLVMVI